MFFFFFLSFDLSFVLLEWQSSFSVNLDQGYQFYTFIDILLKWNGLDSN